MLMHTPKYPVFIISKGRARFPFTANLLKRLSVPFKIVVEPQEVDEYAETVGEEYIVALPFSNLGFGSIPARNFCWEKAIEMGAERHWILDDNIRHIFFLNYNRDFPVSSGWPFSVAEYFVEQFENIGLAGFNYDTFAPRMNKRKPCAWNCRIYSCILIDNSLPFRWRGRYNEDVDLSLNALRHGYSTVLFHAFIIDKIASMSLPGGNTDTIYSKRQRSRMLMTLQAQVAWPQNISSSWKYNRWHHIIKYSHSPVPRLKDTAKPIDLKSAIKYLYKGMEYDPKTA